MSDQTWSDEWADGEDALVSEEDESSYGIHYVDISSEDPEDDDEDDDLAVAFALYIAGDEDDDWEPDSWDDDSYDSGAEWDE